MMFIEIDIRWIEKQIEWDYVVSVMLLYASISVSLYLMQTSIVHNLTNKSQPKFLYLFRSLESIL